MKISKPDGTSACLPLTARPFTRAYLLLVANTFALSYVLALLAVTISLTLPARSEEKVVIGLDADFSGNAPQSGLSIERGMQIAIDEVNANGGVLGRRLVLQSMDNRGVPARGLDNLEQFLLTDNLVALVGGLHSPVMLAQSKKARENNLVIISAWAAATPVVDNGYSPNFVFRVSARDEHAGTFLMNAAHARGFQRPALLLWQSGWGRSNEASMKAAINRLGLDLAGIEWFNITENDFTEKLEKLKNSGADVVMLVANPDEGIAAVRAMAALDPDRRLPIISHWGIAGTDFFGLDPEAVSTVDLTFLQTFSFFDPPFADKASALFQAYCRKYGECRSVADIVAPTGTAHGYDIVHLVARAVEKAGTTDRGAIRAALENLDRYEGLVRVYDPPFSPDNHEALGFEDYTLATFDKSGAITPLTVAPSQ